MTDFPTFLKELDTFGSDNTSLSKALSVSTKTIERYKAGKLPTPLLKLLQHPQLLRALATDAESQKIDEQTVNITA